MGKKPSPFPKLDALSPESQKKVIDAAMRVMQAEKRDKVAREAIKKAQDSSRKAVEGGGHSD